MDAEDKSARPSRPCSGAHGIAETCPAGVLPIEEAVLLLYGQGPKHEGEALAKAIIEQLNG